MNKLRKPQSDFTQIPNALLRDDRVSLKAKGVYCLLYSKPDDWIYIEEVLVRESWDGRDAFRSAITELARHGWLSKQQVRKDGVFSHTEIWLHTVAGKPVDGLSVDGKSDATNTDRTNTEEVNPSVSPKTTKASKRANLGIRLEEFLRTISANNGAMPIGWEQYPGELGFHPMHIERSWRAFHRHFTGPDCKLPLKRDWHRAWCSWCDRETPNSRGSGKTGGSSGNGLTAALRSSVASRYGASPAGEGVSRRSSTGDPDADAGGTTAGLAPGEIAF